MLLSGWGRYPVVESHFITPFSVKNAQQQLLSGGYDEIIARGMGRSYGDSSLSPNVMQSLYLNHILDFDENTGLVRCQSGVTLDDLLNVFMSRGWFLNVTPGTRFISVGGAIASDVHGKNHHIDGCFSNHVKSMTLLMAEGNIITCSHEQNVDLFYASCGGMGLTGIILEVELYLKPVASSYIDETVIKASNLEHALELFDEHDSSTYSVAWIDCISGGKKLGRSLLMLGEHSQQAGYKMSDKKKLSVPFNMPSALLNRYSVAAFNALYYHRIRQPMIKHQVHYESFFYPLDGILNWNKLYGKNGFTQYQFVIPKEAGKEGLTQILNKIVASKRGSFLAVLKAFGEKNKNYLSFPIEGYTLALDFKIDEQLFDFLDELDKIVLSFGGRVYLTKDVRMQEEVFKKSYPEWRVFTGVRKKYNADKVFNSLQSERIGI